MTINHHRRRRYIGFSSSLTTKQHQPKRNNKEGGGWETHPYPRLVIALTTNDKMDANTKYHTAVCMYALGRMYVYVKVYVYSLL